jgi:hypothetical protein
MAARTDPGVRFSTIRINHASPIETIKLIVPFNVSTLNFELTNLLEEAWDARRLGSS